MTLRLVECVPNFSEGRDLMVVAAIRDAIAAVDGVTILHVTSDASHNRSVITFVAPATTVVDAAFAGIRMARERIDLTKHTGVHPRIGAADVVPFVPLDGTTMTDCIALARKLGERVGAELDIPVYLYERAATRLSRENLADVRRGEFEGLRETIETDPERVPDFGPSRVHPTFGAVAIGARPFLVAFNMYLGSASNLSIAKEVAKAVRASSGGLPYVKALGLDVDGQAQVSMNLVDTERTPLSTVFEAVRREAVARGVQVTWSEIIGLVPERVIFETAAKHLRLRQPIDGHVLERRILAEQRQGQTTHGYVEAVGSSDPAPGGGSVAAYAGALAAALVKMVAGLTLGRERYASVHAEMATTRDEARTIAKRLAELTVLDTTAYTAVTAAYALPKTTDAETSARKAAIQAALRTATDIPLEVARLCARIAALAVVVAERGNPNAITDAGTAALLADATCKAATLNVRVNVKALGDAAADAQARSAQGFIEATEVAARKVSAMVEQLLGH